MKNCLKVLLTLLCFLSGNTLMKAQELGPVLTAAQLEQYDSEDKVGKYIMLMGKADANHIRHYGLADKNGKVILQLNYTRDITLSEGIFRLQLMQDAKEVGWVYADTTGKRLNSEVYFDVRPFDGGYGIVQKTQYESGVINKKGGVVIPCNKLYHGLTDYSEGTVVVTPPEGDIHNYLMDSSGTLLFKAPYGKTMGNGGLHSGLILINDIAAKKRGYMDRTGKEVLPFVYESASPFSEGLAGVGQNDKAGFIDKTGKVVIPFKFDGAGSFSEGLADVYEDGGSKMGYVDKTGKLVIQCTLAPTSAKFKNGIATVQDADGNSVNIDKTGKKVE